MYKSGRVESEAQAEAEGGEEIVGLAIVALDFVAAYEELRPIGVD